MAASKSGSDEIVNILLNHGANPNTQDKNGNTPLHYASEYGHLKPIRTLLSAEANPSIANTFSWTPISYSLTTSAEAYFKELIASGLGQRTKPNRPSPGSRQGSSDSYHRGSGSGGRPAPIFRISSNDNTHHKAPSNSSLSGRPFEGGVRLVTDSPDATPSPGESGDEDPMNQLSTSAIYSPTGGPVTPNSLPPWRAQGMPGLMGPPPITSSGPGPTSAPMRDITSPQGMPTGPMRSMTERPTGGSFSKIERPLVERQKSFTHELGSSTATLPPGGFLVGGSGGDRAQTPTMGRSEKMVSADGGRNRAHSGN
jgi:Ankyrin repeats (3 copies)